ncbi:putative pentatricopeptide repeat-containing protein At3g13770, mitochondrial [Cynara cardunculus var. scolymus]|uniref:putative pentatricopeptide repeat-containing protein At3g13770, mitochondrial n=1 Tax=Cynara cardunculus var. scolymus TaxID=59895 RepID=UPI000D62AC44|nr:putative pentatricopeptide repeat-containing protein At3g13770, mitochondrial [Cynara cardunculus var. scolymus]
MAKLGLQMNFLAYDTLLNECVKQKSIRGGQRVHAHMIKTQYRPPLYLGTRLLVLYNKCDCLWDARQVFDEMPDRNVVSWTAMMSAYSKKGYASQVLNLLVVMLRSGTEPNEYTFATVLTCCTGVCGLEHGKQVHNLIIKNNFESHLFVGCSLLDMYAKAGRIHEARSVFEDLPERDVVSCTAIISGYAQLGLDEDALELFRSFQREGMASNYVTYASVLTAVSGLAAYEMGKQIHSHVLRSELPFYVILENSLIDMYSKCGQLAYARRVFDKMSERSVISWNAMLVGYSKHGMAKEVAKLFELMRKENKVQPDKVTFLAILSGCSHGEMENRGLEVFDEMMSGKDGVVPDIEHYGCVVDLLGRAGQVEKAYEFIKQMPLEPNAAIWGSLLGACLVHSNVDIGEIVGHRLLEIEPENSGNYVILSNLFASRGRWDDVRTIRSLMKEKAVAKDPGKSWIEVDQTLHTFHAGDRLHPKMEEVHDKMNELSIKVKENGYSPDLSRVLYDVDDEQKEKILLGHSEKLALAFGLISSPEGKPIRIMKNLRVCVDCHSFAKVVSQICQREVFMRDKNRFHHIVGGVCSCGDYW